jgi:phospholipid/cholesterol/gamma-HCH transport system substrate-binding protein
MERRANYALVGIVTVGLTVGLFAFIVWLAGFSFNKHYDVYNVVFVGPVRGISEGGEVHFNGIKVGEVTRLELDPADPNRVIARVRLTAGVPVRVDSYAILEPQGITGVNYIQITGGANGKPMLKDVTPHGVIPVIHSQKSTLADLLEGGGTVLQRAVETLDRVNRLLSDKNIDNISGTISDFKALGEELKERRALVAQAQQAIEDADETAKSINELAQSSNKLVNGDGKRTLAKLADAAEDLKQTSHEARAMLAKLQGPTSDFATNGLPQLTATITSLQQTSRSLDTLARELQQSPQGALAKPPAKELKVKQ